MNRTEAIKYVKKQRRLGKECSIIAKELSQKGYITGAGYAPDQKHVSYLNRYNAIQRKRRKQTTVAPKTEDKSLRLKINMAKLVLRMNVSNTDKLEMISEVLN